jgi:hypothetical protein
MIVHGSNEFTFFFHFPDRISTDETIASRCRVVVAVVHRGTLLDKATVLVLKTLTDRCSDTYTLGR